MFYNDFTLNYFKDLKYSGSLINPTLELPRAKARGFLFHRKQP